MQQDHLVKTDQNPKQDPILSPQEADKIRTQRELLNKIKKEKVYLQLDEQSVVDQIHQERIKKLKKIKKEQSETVTLEENQAIEIDLVKAFQSAAIDGDMQPRVFKKKPTKLPKIY